MIDASLLEEAKEQSLLRAYLARQPSACSPEAGRLK
jgi:hypothetical protein